ncbi:MAG: response regulator [Myxococcales bacterium]|nr:response regulator [Myxococcales bacterium]
MASKPRLLLVDDDVRLRRAASHVLSTFFAVTEAASAREALQRIEGNETFDVLLTDLEMPGGDAIDLLAELANRNLPLIHRSMVWSGFELDEPELVFYASHGIPILSKSLPTAEIARLLLARASVTTHARPR